MNRRIRKKHNCPYIQLKKYKPGEIAIFTTDLNDNNCDMGEVVMFLEQCSNALPDNSAAILLPNYITLQSGDTDILRFMLDKGEEVYRKLVEQNGYT